ncbi:TonB-dependent receptor [Caulobacter sp. CCNWLW153]|uniref:TonB-dependent receptor plug domain-containing protein n=1 Tax=Caulobacter sp. CCNWLW153 TaxID=3122396 RepID=UPI002FEE7BF5
MTRKRLLTTTIISGLAIAAASAGVASAQTAPEGESTEIEAVVVTGSRIARQDYVANSPISTVTSEAIQAAGSTTTEDVLNRLPQVMPGLTAASNNPSDGTATVDLRGVGASRTLVLVNGHRMNPSTRANTVDLNNIPTALIDKVEIVTGGASAVYGSDALSGVVNFQLKKNFEGVELGTQWTGTEIGDGKTTNTYVLIGANSPDGKGNVTAYANYYSRDKILPNADRPWSLVSNAGGSGTGVTGAASAIGTNPFVSPALAALLATRPNPTAPIFFDRRMEEVGPRVETRDSDLYQINLGLKADLGHGWTGEAFYSFGRTEFRVGVQNDVSRSKVAAAIASGAGASTTSCSTASLALFPTCAPLNMFGAGTISPAAANFIRLNFSDLTVFERNVGSVYATGPLFKLPAGDLSVAVGAEWREDSLAFTPDAAKNAGDIFGFNAERAVGGASSVGELYAEAVVPLVADVTGVQYLGLELGGRYSDYSSVGSVYSYKVGLEYKPISDIKLRAMFQKASRAPSVFELYQSGDQGFPAVLDPCTTVNPGTGAARTLSAAVRTFCTAQLGYDPVAGNFVAQNTQTESFFYGNPSLNEEKSETITFGVVWQPSFISGLSATVDYYDIKIDDYIGTIKGGVSGIVNDCFASGNLTSAACFDSGINLPLIYRDAAGNLKARAPLGNVSSLQTKGIDVAVSYGWNVPWAGGVWGDKLQFDLSTTYLDSYELDGIEYKGTIGAYNISASLPEWKASLRVGYDVGPVRLAYTGTYVGKMDNQGNIPDFEDGGYNTVKAFMYHDVSARWAVNDNVEVFGGVRNLGDKKPPVFDNSPDGNTDPNTYDILGRSYFLGAKLRF